MMAAGQLTNGELSRRWGVSCARVSQLKAELGRQAKLRWGDGALADEVAEPGRLRGSYGPRANAAPAVVHGRLEGRPPVRVAFLSHAVWLNQNHFLKIRTVIHLTLSGCA
jgi:hypothetical protein